jgi:hypothetical protein
MLQLRQLGVDALEGGGLGDQDIHLHVIADRHLVEEPAELGLHEREAFRQPLALGEELGGRRDIDRIRDRWYGCAAPRELHGTTT